MGHLHRNYQDFRYTSPTCRKRCSCILLAIFMHVNCRALQDTSHPALRWHIVLEIVCVNDLFLMKTSVFPKLEFSASVNGTLVSFFLRGRIETETKKELKNTIGFLKKVSKVH